MFLSDFFRICQFFLDSVDTFSVYTFRNDKKWKEGLKLKINLFVLPMKKVVQAVNKTRRGN
jgi:hypothetical protein